MQGERVSNDTTPATKEWDLVCVDKELEGITVSAYANYLEGHDTIRYP